MSNHTEYGQECLSAVRGEDASGEDFMTDALDIRRNQIWRSRKNPDYQVLISTKVGGYRWKVKKLTNRPGVYNGTHTLNTFTLQKAFELIA